MTVTVGMPMAGFFSGQTATAATYVNTFEVTDSGPNRLYLISTMGDILSVNLNGDLAGIATASKVSNTVYAVDITGIPSSGFWYDASVTVDRSSSGSTQPTETYYASLQMVNKKSALMVYYSNWNNNVPSPGQRPESSIRMAPGYSQDVYPVFVSGGTSETTLVPTDIHSSDDSIITVSANPEHGNLLRITAHSFGSAQLLYTDGNNNTYSLNVTVGLPDMGFYKAPSASTGNYITDFTLTDTGSNVVYLAANNGTLSNVTLDNDFAAFANAVLSSDGTYATITMTGTPAEDRWYNVDAQYHGNNGNSGNHGVSLKVTNGKAALKFKDIWWNNNVPEESMEFNTQFTMSPGFTKTVKTYFVSSNGQQSVPAGSLASSNTNVIRVSVNPEDSNMVNLEAVGFGQAVLTYTHTDGKTYNLNVTVDIPDVGYYSSPNASQSTYLSEFVLRDSDSLPRKFYLVNRNGTLRNVKLSNDLASYATYQMSSDNTYAEITLTDIPAAGWYEVEAEVVNGNDSWRMNQSIQIKNYMTSLQYSGVYWNNNVPTPSNNRGTGIQIPKGYEELIFAFFMQNGAESQISAGSLESTDETVVQIIPDQSNPQLMSLRGVEFGTAQICYEHSDGRKYNIDVEVGLPDIGYYSAKTASQANFISSYTVTETSSNKIYIAGLNDLINSVQLSYDFDQIADVQVSNDGRYAEITITGTPGNRWYDAEVFVPDGNGGTQRYNCSIELINGKGALMLRFPGQGGVEDTNNSLENSYSIWKGQNEPAYFYFVKGGQETKLSLSDLSSSDTDVFTLDVYSGSDAIVLESVNCGTAAVQYTTGGVTYTLPIEVELPVIACYSHKTVSEANLVKEFTVTDTADELYILTRDGEKIVNVTLLRALANVATVSVAADGSYATLKVNGTPDGQNYDFEVLVEDADGKQEFFYGNVTLNNGKPYIGFCWPEENDPSGHGPIETCLYTAKGYGTDVWVYYVEGTTETRLGFADLKSSDTDVLQLVDPHYGNGMVNLSTVGWGQAAVTYEKNGKTYSFDIISDVQDYGYYTELRVARDTWIRSFTVTDENDTFYFISNNGTTFDAVYPTQDLADIANITVSADKSYIEIRVTGEPSEYGEYGLEFEITGAPGMRSVDILDFIKDLRTKVEVEDLPVINPKVPVTEVTVGVDQSKTTEALEETTKEIVNTVADGSAATQISQDVADSIKNALDNESELKVTTTVYIEPLKKEEIQDEELLKDIETIEDNLGDGLIAQYLDLGVIMTTYVDGVEDASGEVSKLAKPVVFTVALPDALKQVPAGYNRTIYVIYVHDGVVKSIPTTVNPDGTVSFEASEFSTYALAYEDVEENDDQQSGDGEQNGDNISGDDQQTGDGNQSGNSQQPGESGQSGSSQQPEGDDQADTNRQPDSTAQSGTDEQSEADTSAKAPTTIIISPHTGDSTGLIFLWIAAFLSLAGIAVLFLRKRRI